MMVVQLAGFVQLVDVDCALGCRRAHDRARAVLLFPLVCVSRASGLRVHVLAAAHVAEAAAPFLVVVADLVDLHHRLLRDVAHVLAPAVVAVAAAPGLVVVADLLELLAVVARLAGLALLLLLLRAGGRDALAVAVEPRVVRPVGEAAAVAEVALAGLLPVRGKGEAGEKERFSNRWRRVGSVASEKNVPVEALPPRRRRDGLALGVLVLAVVAVPAAAVVAVCAAHWRRKGENIGG